MFFNSKIISAIFIMFCISVCSQAQTDTITYKITARNLSLEAVNSYPQKLINFQHEDSLYKVIVSTFPIYKDSTVRKKIINYKYIKDRIYPDSIKQYLEPTLLTNYNLPEIKNVADSILNLKDTLTSQLITRCLKYTSKRIKYDNELAIELDQGRSTTLDVETILRRNKGTCSESTNIFLALIRRVGIPSRMAVGYIYIPSQNFKGSHAWAECYIDNYGWLAVDPQNGFMWYPPVAIKLFHGKDFIDCNIKTLPDMYPVSMEILE